MTTATAERTMDRRTFLSGLLGKPAAVRPSRRPQPAARWEDDWHEVQLAHPEVRRVEVSRRVP